MNKVQELQAKRNAITAKIAVIEREGALANSALLIEEILNLFGEVGDGFIREDSYSVDRYSSAISGVKNLRISESLVAGTARFADGLPSGIGIENEGREYIDGVWVPSIKVKIYGVEGYLLPETVKIPGYGKFTVKVIRSRKYG